MLTIIEFLMKVPPAVWYCCVFIIRQEGQQDKKKEAVTVEIGRILPTEAAMILNVSPQFVRIAMQQGKLPIGTAIKMSSIWTYHISEKLLQDYSGKNVEQEIKRIRNREEGI